MGNSPRDSIHGVATVSFKFTSGKTVQLKNLQHVLSINKNLFSGSFLYRDGFKLVFVSNEFVISKYGQFVAKGYDAEACSAYLRQTYVLKLLIMLAMIVSSIFAFTTLSY
jgi:hypothetical protein